MQIKSRFNHGEIITSLPRRADFLQVEQQGITVGSKTLVVAVGPFSTAQLAKLQEYLPSVTQPIKSQKCHSVDHTKTSSRHQKKVQSVIQQHIKRTMEDATITQMDQQQAVTQTSQNQQAIRMNSQLALMDFQSINSQQHTNGTFQPTAMTQTCSNHQNQLIETQTTPTLTLNNANHDTSCKLITTFEATATQSISNATSAILHSSVNLNNVPTQLAAIETAAVNSEALEFQGSIAQTTEGIQAEVQRSIAIIQDPQTNPKQLGSTKTVAMALQKTESVQQQSVQQTNGILTKNNSSAALCASTYSTTQTPIVNLPTSSVASMPQNQKAITVHKKETARSAMLEDQSSTIQTSEHNRNQPQITRLGLVVSKRVGNAVVRNHIKRTLRALFRQRFYESSDMPLINRQLNYVIIAKTRSAQVSHQILAKDLDYCLAKLQQILLAIPKKCREQYSELTELSSLQKELSQQKQLTEQIDKASLQQMNNKSIQNLIRTVVKQLWPTGKKVITVILNAYQYISTMYMQAIKPIVQFHNWSKLQPC